MIIDLHDALNDEDNNLENMEFNDQNKEQDQVSVYMTKKYELSDLVSSYFLLIKGYFSIGILTFPMIFYQAGYLLAAGVIIMIGILTVYSVNLLIQIQEDINKKQSVEEDNAPILHYSDIAQAIYGNKGVFIIKTFTVVFQIGSCLSYLVFFKQFFQETLINVNQSENKVQNNNLLSNIFGLFIQIIIFMLISLLSTVRNIKKLTKICIIGIFLSMISCLVIIGFDIQLIRSSELQKYIAYYNSQDMYNFQNFPQILNVTVFSYSIIGIVFNIKNSMKNQKQFKPVFRNCTIIISIIFIVFGFINQIVFGAFVKPIVLFNFPSTTKTDQIMSIFIKFSFSIAMILTFPLKLFPAVLILENTQIYKKYFRPDYMVKRKNSFGVDVYSYNLTLNDDKIQFLRRYFVRILIIFGIFLLSTIQGKFLNILSIVGSIGGIFNQFVFPSMMYERYFSKKIKPWKSLVNKFTQICGVMGGLLGIYIGLGKV